MYGMASSEQLLDWNGNPIPGVIRRTVKDTKFRIYKDENGKEYWMNDGKRDYELPFLTVLERNESEIFETVYDSRCRPPQPAKA